MSNINLYSGGSPGRMLTRQAGKALTRIEEQTVVNVGRVRAQATEDAAKLQAIGAIAQEGMQAVAMVSQLEQQLAQAVPLATSRLQALGDVAALAMSQTLADSAAKLRQL